MINQTTKIFTKQIFTKVVKHLLGKYGTWLGFCNQGFSASGQSVLLARGQEYIVVCVFSPTALVIKLL